MSAPKLKSWDQGKFDVKAINAALAALNKAEETYKCSTERRSDAIRNFGKDLEACSRGRDLCDEDRATLMAPVLAAGIAQRAAFFAWNAADQAVVAVCIREKGARRPT